MHNRSDLLEIPPLRLSPPVEALHDVPRECGATPAELDSIGAAVFTSPAYSMNHEGPWYTMHPS